MTPRQAHWRVTRAIKSGRLKRPKLCEDCGCPSSSSKRPLAGHHENYERPLDVVWLCPYCHRGRHRKTGWEKFIGMKPGPKPASAAEFRKRYDHVIKARKAGRSYKEIARTFRPPVSPQRIHAICKRAGVTT